MPLMVPTAANKRFDTDYYVEGYPAHFEDPEGIRCIGGIVSRQPVYRYFRPFLA